MAGKAGSANNHRLTVALTFDFDTEPYWLFSVQGPSSSAVSRGTYGAREGVPRILKLLDKYGLPATWGLVTVCYQQPVERQKGGGL